MVVEFLTANATTIGLGGITGFLIGYAVKKILKILAIVVGLFFAGFIYLESQGIANINWNKIQTAVYSLANTIPYANLPLPLTDISLTLSTSSAAAGFTLGFIKG